MQKDERDLLEVLKFELNFLEKGGLWAFPARGVEAAIHIRGFADLHELRFQGKSGALQPLRPDATGATGFPLGKNSVPSHSDERGWRGPGFALSV